MKVQDRDRTPELTKAKYAVWDYFKKHNLDPGKDYTKDPVHGEIVTGLLIKLNKERDKEILRYPARDLTYQLNFTKKMKKNKEAKEAKKAAKAAEEKATKKAKVQKVEKAEKKEKNEKAPRKTAKYDYPLVDGREMTKEEKKKYRVEQRKKLKKADKDEAPAKKEKKEKVSKKEAKVEAPAKKKDKKKKHKEED